MIPRVNRNRSRHVILLCSAALWLGTHALLAQPAEPPKPLLTKEQQEKLKEAEDLDRKVVELYGKGKAAQAVPLAEKALSIRKQILGEKHPHIAGSLNNLADLCRAQEEYARAEPLYRQALAIYKAVLGDKHPDYATTLQKLAALSQAQGDYAKAVPLCQQALAILKEVLGEKHPDYATTLHNLAFLYKAQRDYAKAEPLYRQAVAIFKEVLGEKSPAYATSLNSLAALFQAQGKYAKAEPLYRQALDIRKEVLGEKHPDYATSLHNLAFLHLDGGDYAKAEPLCRQAADIRKEVLGEKHPAYADSLNNLAISHKSIGEYATAEPLYRQALDIKKEALGKKHPDYAASLHNLAVLYQAQGKYSKAEPLYRQAAEIRKEVLGEKHPDYAASLNYLAMLYHAKKDHAKAEPLCREALEIRKEVLGEKHPVYAASLSTLASLYQAQGEYAKAEPLCRQAADIRKEVEGEKHPDYADTLHNLALLDIIRNKPHEGYSLAAEVIEITRHELVASAFIQSERQQLAHSASVNHRLSGYLSAAVAARVGGEEVYPAVLAWKGAVLARQQAIRVKYRLLQRAGQTEATKLYADLEQKSRELANLGLAPFDPKRADERRQRLEKLSEEIDQLEQALAKESAEFRAALDQRERTAEHLRKALPADAVLVDLLEYYHFSPPEQEGQPGKWERRLAGFLVRPGKPVEWINLKRVGPIAAAIDVWREGVAHERTTAEKREAARQAAHKLRELVWEPLEAKIGEAKIVLISPDGATARFPWAALPGKKPGTYLIEERAIAMVPVPQLLPELSKPAEASGLGPALLVVGDVDFGAAPGVAKETTESKAAPRGGYRNWGELTGTRPELLAIRSRIATRTAP